MRTDKCFDIANDQAELLAALDGARRSLMHLQICNIGRKF